MSRYIELEQRWKNSSLQDRIEHLKSLQAKEWNSIREAEIKELERRLKDEMS